MKSYNTFLENLSQYPTPDHIDEASNYAQKGAAAYLATLDPEAVLTVEDGETYVQSEKEIDPEFLSNVQTTFDEAFGEKIAELGYQE